ncbi:MAG: AAA family ATPase [Methylococcaceae bacterium]
MAVEHIENIEIINFKCFKHLTVSDIGKVNLIGGKNNVGKTAFLEAVELYISSNQVYYLAESITKLLERRQHKNESLEFDLIDNITEYIKISSKLKNISIQLVGDSLRLGVDKNEEKIKINSIPLYMITKAPNRPVLMHDSDGFLISPKFQADEVIYISTSKIEEESIALLLGQLIDLGREDFLNKSLLIFDKDILEIKQIMTKKGVSLKLKINKKDSLVLLSSLGEGINRYIAILCAIWASKDGVLLIDEIENGIHYTNYKKLWEIIFKTSVEANCQLFITTHSKECIMAFNEAQFEYENSNASYIELYKNKKKDDLITAAVRDKEQLQYSLNNDGRIRGE